MTSGKPAARLRFRLRSAAGAHRPASPPPSRRLADDGRRPRSPARSATAGSGNSPGCMNPGDLLVLNDTRVLPGPALGDERRGQDRVPVHPGDRARPLGGPLPAGQKGARRATPFVSRAGIDGPGGRARGGGPAHPRLREDRRPRPSPRNRLRSPAALHQEGQEQDETDAARGHRPLSDGLREEGRRHRRPDRRPALHSRRAAGALGDRGVDVRRVTLDVGLATFQPVRAELVADHRMLEETYAITPAVAKAINAAKAEGRPVTAVGTTVVRTLESAGRDGAVRPGRGATSLFITPRLRVPRRRPAADELPPAPVDPADARLGLRRLRADDGRLPRSRQGALSILFLRRLYAHPLIVGRGAR